MNPPIPQMANGPGPTIRDQMMPQLGPRLTTNLRDFMSDSSYQSSLVRNPSARTEIGNVRSLADRFDKSRGNIESVYEESSSPPKLPERSGSRMSRQNTNNNNNSSSLESLNNIITEMQQNIPKIKTDTSPAGRGSRMTVGMPKPQRRPISSIEDPYQVQKPPSLPIKETSIDDVVSPVPKNDASLETGFQKIVPVSTWLSEKLKQVNQDNWKVIAPSTRTVGTETFELKQEQNAELNKLQGQITDLECQLKIKERELETNEYIAKELSRKLKNAGELFDVRRCLENTERHYDDQVRMNQELTEENAKLMDQIQERNQKILQYQAELDNLERIISSKNALDEEGLRRKLEVEVKRLSDELQDKSRQLAIGHKEITMVHAEVKRKEKDLELRDHRITTLLDDIRHLKERINEAEMNHAHAESNSRNLSREKSVLQTMIDKKEPFNAILDRLQDENLELKAYIDELEGKNKLLENSRDLAHQLSQELKELNTAIADKNLANLEKDRIGQTLAMMEKMLREKDTEQESLKKQLQSVQEYIYELERENTEHRNLESSLKANSSLLIEAERNRVELAKKLAVSQRKWAFLSSACLDRNHLLNDMLREWQGEGRLSSVNQNKVDQLIHEELPLARVSSDLEIIPKEWLTEPTTEDRIRLQPKVLPAIRNKDLTEKTLLPRVNQVRESPGDLNPEDRKSSYLNPDELYKYIGSGHRYSDWLARIARNETGSTRRNEPNISAPGQQQPVIDLLNEDISMENMPVSMDANNMDFSVTEKSMEKFQRPSPPREVRGRLVSDDDWLVEWSPPLMDENEVSNGFKVGGYRLTINDHEVKRVASPWLCKALIKISSLPADYNPRNSTAHLRNQICVQTVALTGHLSRAAAARIENSSTNLSDYLKPEED